MRARNKAARMVRQSSLLTITLLGLAIAGAFRVSAPRAATTASPLPPTSEPVYITPVELKFSPDGRRLYVVAEGSDSVLALDVASKRVVMQAKVGHKPKGIALAPDGKMLYVSAEWADTISEIDAGTFQVRRALKAGWGPVGLTTDKGGKFLYVANSISNDVSILDLSTGQEIKRLAARRYPRHVLLSRDGRRVYVSNLLAHLGPYDEPPVSELTAIDTEKQVVAERILIPGVIELRHIAEAPAGLGGYLLVPFMRPKNLGPLIQVPQGWVLTHGMAIIRPARRLPAGEPETKVTQVLLDDIDYSYADGYGAAFTPDGRYALVTASGTNLVSVIDTGKLAARMRSVPSEELADRLDSAREFVVRRLPTDDDPRAIAVAPEGRYAYIANRLADNLTVVDLAQLKVAGTIDLGGPKELSMLRRGERVFRNANYCFQGQFSCATCHPEDHLDGLAWNLETPRLGRDRVANRTLRAIRETAPFKWSGGNPDLASQCGPRIAKFLFRSEGFDTEQLQDLITFLNSIPAPPNRHLAANGELTEAQERGKAMFYRERTNEGEPIPIHNRCDTCHPADTHYTNRLGTRVGSATKYDTSDLFDTPQLDRVYENAPFLHNGMALTLEEIWTVYNNEDTHGVTSDMRKEQLNDLIEYLKTL